MIEDSRLFYDKLRVRQLLEAYLDNYVEYATQLQEVLTCLTMQ